MSALEKRLGEMRERFRDLEAQLSDPAVMSNRETMTRLSREHAELLPTMKDFAEWERVLEERSELKGMIDGDDSELAEMAKAEAERLSENEAILRERLETALRPKDPFADRDIIMEIRAGTGGEEAALFAGDLFRMYNRYAEEKGWKVETLSSHATGRGGFKEIIFNISGSRVYERLQFEGGTHRVQRVPETEAQGRIHTSAATVAVLPEADEVDIEIKPEEIRVDVFRSSGPGGQSVNTTDSAVRITHLPTGLVVSCQDEKSQHKNRARALKVLRSRLLEMEQARQAEEQHAQRRTMVGSGDRSGRIRTYNFPQNRLTDHRINLTIHRLEAIMEGDLDEIIDSLTREYRQKVIQENI